MTYPNLRTCLVHAVTRYDRTRRTPQPIYALGHYLNAVDRICTDYLNSDLYTIEQACRLHLNGPLLSYVLKFIEQHYERSN